MFETCEWVAKDSGSWLRQGVGLESQQRVGRGERRRARERSDKEGE